MPPVDHLAPSALDEGRDSRHVEAERSSRLRRPAASSLVWLVVAIAGLVLLERQQTPRTFFFDEWDFVLTRRSGGLDAFLRPHNGHLSVLPVIAYRIGLAMFGLDHYRPFRVLGLLVHIAVASGVFVLVRRACGSAAGVCCGALVLLLGAGWQDIFWPFQIGFMGSIAFALIAWAALDRTTARATAIAAVAVAGSLACSGLGIAVLVGTAAKLASTRNWKRFTPTLLPGLALYAVWYLAYGESQGSSSNVGRIPRFVVDSMAGSTGALLGRDLLWGRLLAGMLIGGGAVLIGLHRVPWRAVAAPAVAAGANWVLTGYSRADVSDPATSRYVYVGAVLLVLVIAGIVGSSGAGWLRGALAVGALLGIAGNWQLLHDGARGLQATTAITRGELRAVEWAGSVAAPTYRPDPQRMPQVSTGPYLTAVRELGSPAASDGEVAVSTPATRAEVDRVSTEVLAIALTAEAPRHRLDTPGTVVSGTGSLDSDGCTSVTTVAQHLVVDIDVVAGHGIVIGSHGGAVEVQLRRYAEAFPGHTSLVVAPGATQALKIGIDAAPRQTWSVELTSDAPVTVCAVAG